MTADNGNGQGCMCQSRANVRCHVVWPFERMPIVPLFFRHKSLKEIAQIVGNVGIRVLLDYERTGSVLDKNRQRAVQDGLIPKPVVNCFSKRIKPFPFGCNGKSGMRGGHLLYRNALSEVARLIDVATAPNRNIVSEQLQRNHFEQGKQQLACMRHCDQVVGHFC